MKRPLWPKKYLSIFVFSSFLLSCGLEQYYYLPQLSQDNIQLTSNNSAAVIIPSIEQYYYATNYSIYYRIYIGNELNPNFNDKSSNYLTSINPSLNTDYNAIFPSTDPTNTTANTAINTLFKSRNYFELELNGVENGEILSKRGGTLRLEFPAVLTAENPASYAVLNNGKPVAMRRSSQLFYPVPDYTFNNSNDLSNQAYANANANADVASINANPQYFAYVSMYIAAVGTNAEFSPIYSKPTHIGIFKLPDY